MSKPIDRALGRAEPPQSAGFDVRPFGTTRAEAAAIAASSGAAAGSVAGTTGGSGSAANLTSSSYRSVSSSEREP